MKKRHPQKSFFFAIFLIFQVFQSRFFCIFSYSGTLLVVIFGHFSGFTFFIDFFRRFLQFFGKFGKWKNTFGPVKHVWLWELPSCKKGENALKKATEKTLIFHRKSGKKAMKKPEKTGKAEKSIKHPFRWPHFPPKVAFWVDFGLPAGSKNGLKMVTKKRSTKRAHGPHWNGGGTHRKPIQKIHVSIKTSD